MAWLIDKDILYSHDSEGTGAEAPLSTFFWNLRRDGAQLTASPIRVVGINPLGDAMVKALGALGISRIGYKSDPGLDEGALDGENSSESPESTWSLTVACSMRGCSDGLLRWNEVCFGNRAGFLPVALEDWTGFIGPLVVPGETACLACCNTRYQASLLEPRLEVELRQHRQRATVLSYASAMVGIIAQLATLETIKYILQLPDVRYNSVVEFALMASQTVKRRVLRVPGCSVCGTDRGVSSLSLQK